MCNIDKVVPQLLFVGFVIVFAACAADSSQLQELVDEGLRITKRVNFRSSPETKLQTAQDLLTHASKYDHLTSQSTALEYTAKARSFQRQEREAAATLMREAAADYAKRQQMAKARDVYNSILSRFPDEDYRLIRQAVESSLTQLDELEKAKK